jgi:hypothetical protein
MIEIDLMWEMIRKLPYVVPRARAFRRNILNAQTEEGWRAVNGIKGQCDCYVYVRPGGTVIEVETKAKGGVLSLKQHAWKRFCVDWGIPHLVLLEAKGDAPEVTVDKWIAEIARVVG